MQGYGGYLDRRAIIRNLAGFAACVTGLGLAGGSCGVLSTPPPQQIRTVRLGVLNVSRREDSAREFHALVEWAAALGWREGDNLVIEDRWGNGQRAAVVPLA